MHEPQSGYLFLVFLHFYIQQVYILQRVRLKGILTIFFVAHLSLFRWNEYLRIRSFYLLNFEVFDSLFRQLYIDHCRYIILPEIRSRN